MFKKFSFWLWMTVIFQFLTGIFHSISLFIKLEPQNDTEKQGKGLMDNYHMSAGMGFSPTFANLFLALSACFALLCLFAGAINIYLWKKKMPLNIMKGVMGINVIFFGVCFVLMFLFTFFPPILCTGLIFISSVAAYFTAKERW